MKFKNLIMVSVFLITPLFALAEDITVQAKGMVCSFCAQGIEKKFKAMPEVSDVKVSLETKKIALDLKEGQALSDDLIRKTITESGYEVVTIERKK
jgi:mercuric ion binding protein